MVTMATNDPPPPHMVTPSCVELRPSAVASDGSLGVWCKEAIAAKQRFGPYAGEVIMGDDVDGRVDFRFAWEVVNKETGKLMHVISATKPEAGNWMRYVNCARYFEEQNIVSVQEGTEVYYEAIKEIKPGEELLTWFDPPSSQRSRKRRKAGRSASNPEGDFRPPTPVTDTEPSANGKRRRKKKVDTDMLSLDDEDVVLATSGLHHNKIRTGASGGLRRSSSLPDGKMMSQRRSASIDTSRTRTVTSTPQPRVTADVQTQKTFTSSCQQADTLSLFCQNRTGAPSPTPISAGGQNIHQSRVTPKGPHGKKSISEIVASITARREAELHVKSEWTGGSESNDSVSRSSTDTSYSSFRSHRRHSIVGKADDLSDSSSDFQFLFEIMPVHKTYEVREGKRRFRYACDACECGYRKAVNFKRHYLRTHVNHKYLSEDDVSFCRDIKDLPASVEADIDPDADEADIGETSEEAVETVHGFHDESTGDSSRSASSGKGDKKSMRLACEARLKSAPVPGKTTFSVDGIEGVEDAFRCFLCVQLFPSISKLRHHVENDAHRSKVDKQFGCEKCGQRFRFQHNYLKHVESHGTDSGALSTACHICGKMFLNEANMRKHLRFHSGRNFPCKYGCVDVIYPNVAELVKHLRAVHPDLPKKSEAVHLGNMSPSDGDGRSGEEAQKKKRGRPKLLDRKKVESPVTVQSQPPLSLEEIEARARRAWLESRPPGWVETRGRKPKPGVIGIHCTICKKKFATYGSMCRHRRSIHNTYQRMHSVKSDPSSPLPSSSTPPPPEPVEEEASNEISHEVMVMHHIESSIEQMYQKIEERMEQERLEEENMEFSYSPPPSPSSFYAHVAENIAENLNCHLDGGEHALQTARERIQIDDYIPLSERPGYVAQEEVDWTAYNFPPFFEPVDPVIPHPPAPPVLPDNKLTLLVDGERAPAYPTRAVVAEHAIRRASVGQEAAEAVSGQKSENGVNLESVKGIPESEISAVSESDTATAEAVVVSDLASGAANKSSDGETIKSTPVPCQCKTEGDPNCAMRAAVRDTASTTVVTEDSEPGQGKQREDVKTSCLLEESSHEQVVQQIVEEILHQVCTASEGTQDKSLATLTDVKENMKAAENALADDVKSEELDSVFDVLQVNSENVSQQNSENTHGAKDTEKAVTSAVKTDSKPTSQETSAPASTPQESISVCKNEEKHASNQNPSITKSPQPVPSSAASKVASISDMENTGESADDLHNGSPAASEALQLQRLQANHSEHTSETELSSVSQRSQLETTSNEHCDTPAADISKDDMKSEENIGAPAGEQNVSKVPELAVGSEEQTEEKITPSGKDGKTEIQESFAVAAVEKMDTGSAEANTSKNVSQTDEQENQVSSQDKQTEKADKPDTSKDTQTEKMKPCSSSAGAGSNEGTNTVDESASSSDKTDAKNSQLHNQETTTESETKSEGVTPLPHTPCPSLLSKAAEHGLNSQAASKPTDLNPIPSREVEYLCKGLLYYVRRDRFHCPHVTRKMSKSQAEKTLGENLNRSGEERLIGALDLAGEKEQDETFGKVLKRSNSDFQGSDVSKVEENHGVAQSKNISEVNQLQRNDGTTDTQDSCTKSSQEVSLPQNKATGSTSSMAEATQDQTSQSSIGSGHLADDDRNPDYSDSDTELLDLMMELELRKRKERDSIDQDAEEACEECQRKRQRCLQLEAPAKWSAEDFEKIRFGKHGKHGLVYSVCSMCHRYYGGVDFLIRHQWKKHPSIQCSHVDVELGHNLETLFYLQPSTHGILAQSVLVPPEHLNLETYTCTRCKTSFKQYSRLRSHILNCDPNGPVPHHIRRKKEKLKQKNRHRFMEKMFSGPTPTTGNEKKQGKEMPVKKEQKTALSSQMPSLASGSRHLKSVSLTKLVGTVSTFKGSGTVKNSNTSKLHTSTGKYQVMSSASKSSVRTPSTNSSQSSTPTGYKSGQREAGSPTKSPTKSSSHSSLSQDNLTLSPSPGRGRKRRNYELLYNPAAHVRRRETTECLEVHQCRGCSLRFKTLSLLERHASKCSGKEKLQSQRPVINKFLEPGSKKHPCHYCDKKFTYLKGVANHYRNNFCRMRLERIARGGLTAEDLKHEADLQEDILRQVWNKTENRDHTDVIQGRARLHDDGTITHTRRRGGWPKGVKRGNKRRRHGWTTIKKRRADGSGSGGSVAGSGADDQSGSSTPRSTPSTPSSSPGSASKSVMSELEARLREPVFKRCTKNSAQAAKSNNMESSVSSCEPQLAKQSELKPLAAASQGSAKRKKSGPVATSQRRSSLDIKQEALNEQSEAPVIDKMMGSPKSERSSPDSEPPTLSPVTPLPPPGLGLIPNTQNEEQATRRSTRKRKTKVIETADLESSVVDDDDDEDYNPYATATIKSRRLSRSASTSSAGKSSDWTCDKSSSCSSYQQMTGTAVNSLPSQGANPGTVQHYKLYQLKIPNVAPRVIAATNRDGQSNAASRLDSPSNNPGSKVPAKPLPPNFLFPPPESDKESKNALATGPSLVSFLDTKQTSTSGQMPEKHSKARTIKNMMSPLTVNTNQPVTINSIFKAKKSPQSANSNTNTLKKMGAYRLEKPAVTSTVTTMSAQVNTSGSLTPLAPEGAKGVKLPDVSGASVVKVPSISRGVKLADVSKGMKVPDVQGTTTTQAKPSGSFAPVIPVSSLSMLPPGAMVAVLPTSPILLQTVPSSLPSSTQTSTSPSAVSLTASTSLQTAMAEGKVLIALDARNLQMCLSQASASLSVPPHQAKTATPKTSTVSVGSKARVAPRQQTRAKSSEAQSKPVPSDSTSSGISTMPRPKIDVPNFLFDSNKEDCETTKSESSPPNGKDVTKQSGLPESEGKTESPSKAGKIDSATETEVMPTESPSKSPRKKPRRGPPPGSPGRIKSMSMMTAPGVHTMLSLDIPSSSAKQMTSPTLSSPDGNRERRSTRASRSPKKSVTEGSDDKEPASLHVPDTDDKMNLSPEAGSDEDMPLSQVAAKAKQ